MEKRKQFFLRINSRWTPILMFSKFFTCNIMYSGNRCNYSTWRRWSRRYWKFGDSGMCDNGWCTSGWKWFRRRCKVMQITMSYVSWKESLYYRAARWHKQKNNQPTQYLQGCSWRSRWSQLYLQRHAVKWIFEKTGNCCYEI